MAEILLKSHIRVSKQYASLMFAKMVACAAMIERHLEGILAYWNRKTTNAFLEGLNSVFSAVKKESQGLPIHR